MPNTKPQPIFKLPWAKTFWLKLCVWEPVNAQPSENLHAYALQRWTALDKLKQKIIMKTMKRVIQMSVLTGLLALTAHSVRADTYSIDWYKIAGGGGVSTSATYTVSGTVGQPDAGGAMSGGAYSVTGGFWSLISVVQTPGVPNLTISHVGGSVVVSWPNTGSYTLKQSSDVGASNWPTSGYTVTPGDTNSITITAPTGRLFFRLSK